MLGEPGFDAGAVDPLRSLRGAVGRACSLVAHSARKHIHDARRRLSPSLANRLTIGFAIAFAVLTGLAVIGVARFLQQRQDFEDATARSYQMEIAARNRLAAGHGGRRGARRDRRPAAHSRQNLRDDIDGETRDTALLVGAGLIAGLTGAALLFSGLISSMRRPLEELVDASGRLAAGDLQRPGQGRRPLRDRDPRRRLQRDGRGAAASRRASATSSTG